MSSNSGLTQPGSSTYASDTMYVGDGTWDTSRNTFLLPNLMGLNFETMRYNGMGNRFRDMTGYYPLILAHGVIATIVFLGLVPASVLISRYHWDRYWALKLHIWLQVLSLLLTTVVFMLGWFAVGPQRSLTNPHHGIGLTIFILLIFQVIWGWLVHKPDKRKTAFSIPLKLMVHQWLGRALTILGIVQIPLGLTLYGSPKVLFILYALGAFTNLIMFSVLSYRYDGDSRGIGSDYDSRGSYVSGPSVGDNAHHSSLGRMAAAAAAGTGLAALSQRRSRSKNRSQAENESHASYIDEKFSDESRHRGWGRRLMEITALGGFILLLKRLFGRRRNGESDTESGHYQPAHTRSDSFTEDTMSRVEEGRPAQNDRRPYDNHSPSRRPSRESSEYIDYPQTEEGRRRGLQNALLGAGAFSMFRNMFRGHNDRDEQRRVNEIRRRDLQDERMARANSKRKYTGDGFLPRRTRNANSVMLSDISSSNATPRPPHGPLQGESGLLTEPIATRAVNDEPPTDIPPVPPAHRRTSGSGTGTDVESAAAEVAAGEALSSHVGRHRRRRRRYSRSSRQGDEHVASPPVSVKVKMHQDGRHVTLTRVRRRRTSASSLSGSEHNTERFRRDGEMERQQPEQAQVEQVQGAPVPATGPALASVSSAVTPSAPGPLPAPSNASIQPAPSNPPYGPSSVTSPGTFTGTDVTDVYRGNRRRRREERSRQQQPSGL